MQLHIRLSDYILRPLYEEKEFDDYMITVRYISIPVLFFFLFLSFVACDTGITSKKKNAVEDFFSSPERSSFQLSPDGKKLAYIGYDNYCRNIFILDLENPDSSKQLTYQTALDVQYYFWIDSDKVVYSNTQSKEDSLRILIADIHTEKQELLLPVSNEGIAWLNYHPKDSVLLAAMWQKGEGESNVYGIDINSKKKRLIAENIGDIKRWYVTSQGNIKLALTKDSLDESLLYRESEADPFHEIKKNDFKSNIYPIGFIQDAEDRIYAISSENRDRSAIIELDLTTGESKELFSHPEVDIGKYGYRTDVRELQYVTFETERSEYHFFDKDLEELVTEVQKRFPKNEVDILSSKPENKQIVFRLYSDVNPGVIYYFDGRNGKLELLAENHPKLDKNKLAEIKPVSFKARDQKTITGYLTLPAIHRKQKKHPLVVLVHDGPHRRDSWEFNSEVQFLASRGYAVFQVNYRGSTGYGKDFWTAGFREWGGKMQTDIIDGVTWLIHEGKVDKDRIAIMGSGFGGYSALHAATFNTSLFTCAISSSGYSNLFTYFKEIPPYLQQYMQLFYEVIGNPHTEPDLFRSISPVFHADRVKIPVMFVQGGKDKYSSLTDVNQFVQTLKNNRVPVKFLYKEEEGKVFKKEENIISYYLEVEEFLNKYMK